MRQISGIIIFMKKVLCFGDSNVYGFIPASGKRYPAEIRWSGVLQKLAGDEFRIIEAGCNNRTAFSDNPAGINQTGYKILPSYLEKDLFCTVLAIGINDLQTSYGVNENKIKSGMQNLMGIVRTFAPDSAIILIAPPVITKHIMMSYFSTMFDETSIKKSKELGRIFESVAAENNCEFIDLNKIIVPSELDGLHYTPESHKRIAQAVYDILKNISG